MQLTCVYIIPRGAVEREMNFLGFLMLKNLVKPESPEVIGVLNKAQLRCVMVTGETDVFH